MPLCSPDCAGTLPLYAQNPCGIATRVGGIHRLVFATCDVEIDDPTQLADWQPWIEACKIRTTGPLLGQKPKGSVDKRRFTACAPEQVSGAEKVITFQDFNADDETQSDYAFWNAVLADPTRYQVGWLTCGGLFYGFFPFALELDEIIEDSRKGKTYKEGTITLDVLLLPVGRPIPGLEALLVENMTRTCPPVSPA